MMSSIEVGFLSYFVGAFAVFMVVLAGAAFYARDRSAADGGKGR